MNAEQLGSIIDELDPDCRVTYGEHSIQFSKINNHPGPEYRIYLYNRGNEIELFCMSWWRKVVKIKFNGSRWL